MKEFFALYLLHPNISIHTLDTILRTFPKVLTGEFNSNFVKKIFVYSVLTHNCVQPWQHVWDAHSCAQRRTFVHAYMRTYARACVRAYIRAYVGAYIRAYAHTYACTHARTYVRMNAYVRMYERTSLSARVSRNFTVWFRGDIVGRN